MGYEWIWPKSQKASAHISLLAYLIFGLKEQQNMNIAKLKANFTLGQTMKAQMGIDL